MSDQEWAQAQAECTVAAQRFAGALRQFLATYDKVGPPHGAMQRRGWGFAAYLPFPSLTPVSGL